jgi:DNA-binding NtrC family response regulator
MAANRILVVDDDTGTREFLAEVFQEQEWEVALAATPESALEALDDVDLVLSDIRLETAVDGIGLLRKIKARSPETPVVLMTGFGTLETAVEAVREGAFDFISKPFNIAEVIAIVRRALQSRQAAEPAESKRAGLLEVYSSSGLVGRSREMIALYKEIARVAPSRSTVLVMGESGTGKELIARAIHANSPRSGGRFVAVNCGALTETLLESELFGYQRGAFTGATTDKKGLFEEADQGTIFLDEIGETSPALQVKLLRVLQEGEVRRVGGLKSLRVDVRVIAATNRDLEEEVKRGAFREDLFYRLSVVTLRVPPLRERAEDVPLLVAHFLKRAIDAAEKEIALTDEALKLLAHYTWPGNVRELENTMEYLVLHSRDARITVDDLPAKFQQSAPRLRTGSGPTEIFLDLPSLDELERRYLVHVLKAVGGNRTRAAEVLGIDRRTLYRMAERFGVNLDDAGDGGSSSQ